MFGEWKPFYISDKMRLLRVLDLESTKGLVNHHLNSIWKLVHLKYLSLRSCEGIFHLPDSLGNLKQLQTLDITGTQIIKLPQAIIKLRKLQYIRAGGYYDRPLNRRDVCTSWCCGVAFPFIARLADPRGVVVPRGLKKLKDLHTLGTVNIARGNFILQDIKRLTRLHKLAVTGINKKNCQEFCSTLEHLSRLKSLLVESREKADLRGCLDGLRSPPKNLESLKLLGTLGQLPDWVGSLQNLVKLKLKFTMLTEIDGTIQVLGKLPNLAILRLPNWSFKSEEPCCFTCHREALFPSLTVLELQWPGISSVEFQEGAAPRLELLCSDGPISFSGLSCLRSLKEVLVDEDYYYRSELEDVRGQLTRNPNKPVLKSKVWW